MTDTETHVMRLLDSAIRIHRERGRIITGIVISTSLKNSLKNACCKTLGTKTDPKDLDINKYMGIPIIETSESESRCEVIWKNG